MTPEDHARWLSSAMKDKGLTRLQVADAVGVSARTVTNWVSGRTLPKLHDYFKLRDLLGVYDWDEPT